MLTRMTREQILEDVHNMLVRANRARDMYKDRVKKEPIETTNWYGMLQLVKDLDSHIANLTWTSVFIEENGLIEEDDEPNTDCHCGHPDCGAC